MDLAPGLLRGAEGGRAQWRLTDDALLIGALAMQAPVSLPMGSPDAGGASATAGVNLLVNSTLPGRGRWIA